MPTKKTAKPTAKKTAAKKPAPPAPPAAATPAPPKPVYQADVVCTSGAVTLTFDSEEDRDRVTSRLAEVIASGARGPAVEVKAAGGTYIFSDAHICYLRF